MPLFEALNDKTTQSVEDALSCLAELIYNQPQISQDMWQFLQFLINSIMTD